ncbi:MAG: hypothetical protein E1N59_3084 [Puniceicoccaceae bacterium 5H]|nr:MAG: hypothetical protein E1N59_3084 [Puniceicoccaceae bacterium 5H]
MNFVTIADAPYIPGLLAMLQSMKENGNLPADTRFYVIHEDPLEKRHIESLEQVGISIEFLPRQSLGDVPALAPQYRDLFIFTFKKLLVLKLPVQGKVAFVDSDMLCLNPLDGIEELEHFSAAPAYGNSAPEDTAGGPMINSGFFVYEPSEELFNDVLDYYFNCGRSFDFGDQQVLSFYFRERSSDPLHLCDLKWNTVKRLKHAFPQFFDLDKICFLHYVDTKPWERPRLHRFERHYIPLYHMWWPYFVRANGQKWFPEIKRPVSSNAWEVCYLSKRLLQKLRVWPSKS